MSDAMTYDEAFELGRRIRRDHADVDVVAVGRFLPADQLRTESERWGVSIILPGGTKTVAWSTMAFAMLVAPPKKTSRAKAKPKSKPADDRQAVLF